MIRAAILAAIASCCLTSPAHLATALAESPNFVILYADDLGYGDLGCYGHPTLRTPALDRMAAEGLRFTQFYSAAGVCTPSRAALLTGRLPIRSGMDSETANVLFHYSAGGLPQTEVTLARALSDAGYACGCFGKWHLGHQPQYLPTSHGFETYLGLPYSNDMDAVASYQQQLGRDRFTAPRNEYWNVPLMRNEEIIERPAEQASLTRRYTDAALEFIQARGERPFFVYLPYAMPHVPLFASESFAGKSPRGLFGDAVEEIDHSVGRILDFLRESKLDQSTYVLFSSDNGPWLQYGVQGGSAGLLREGKASTWEGGFRVPGIVWGPGRVPSGRLTAQLGSTLDVLPTCLSLAGLQPPANRMLDGHDLSRLWRGEGDSPRETMFYYRNRKLMAVRSGPWKAHFLTRGGYGPEARREVAHDPPLLFQLEQDPGEQYDVHAAHPDVVASLIKLAEEHQARVTPAPSQLDARLPAQP